MSEGSSVTRPGENKWEVSYESSDSTGSSSGIMTFADERSTESWVGQKVNRGWKISVRVLRTPTDGVLCSLSVTSRFRSYSRTRSRSGSGRRGKSF